jgi:hypothetical protein
LYLADHHDIPPRTQPDSIRSIQQRSTLDSLPDHSVCTHDMIPQTTSKFSLCRSMQLTTAPTKLLGDVPVLSSTRLTSSTDLFKGVRVHNSPTRYARRRQGEKETQPPAHDLLPCMRSIGPCRRRRTFQDDSPRRLAHGAGWTGFHSSRVARGAGEHAFGVGPFNPSALLNQGNPKV